MAYRIFALLITLSTVAGGCSRAIDDFAIPAGHPADPSARRGVAVAATNTLEPELLTIKPQLGANSAPKSAPSPPGNQHMHKQ